VLLIRALSFKGRPVAQEIAARFSEAGGTIGRGESSTLMLPDPERYISRTHATVSFQAGGYVITDNGTKNPVILNGRPLGSGLQARLADGDTLKVGDYALLVTLVPRGAAPIAPVPAGATPKDDPLAGFGGPSPRIGDPFADLVSPAPRIGDPFADLVSPPPRRRPRPDPRALVCPAPCPRIRWPTCAAVTRAWTSCSASRGPSRGSCSHRTPCSRPGRRGPERWIPLTR
jgi:FHA domain